MSFRNMPLQFIACASLQGGRLALGRGSLLVRYFHDPAEPAVDPVITGARSSASVMLDISHWEVRDLGATGGAHTLEVTFRGEDLLRALATEKCSQAELNLYNAFLDQDTIVLELDMARSGAKIAQGGVSHAMFAGALHLKLGYQVCAARA